MENIDDELTRLGRLLDIAKNKELQISQGGVTSDSVGGINRQYFLLKDIRADIVMYRKLITQLEHMKRGKLYDPNSRKTIFVSQDPTYLYANGGGSGGGPV